MKPEKQSSITPKEDLMNEALRHYEEASKAIHDWHSDIPRAIRQFYSGLLENILGIDASVEERLREELIKYTDKEFTDIVGDGTIFVDNYLKSRKNK